MTPLGVVLTGGRSRRFGAPKALVKVEGRAMSIRVAQALRDAGCAPVIAVGEPVGAAPGALKRVWLAAGLEAPAPWTLPVADRWPGEGPLGATLSALATADQTAGVLTAACDLPWLDSEVVRAVLGTTRGRTPDPVRSRGVRYGAVGSHMVPVIWWPIAVRSALQELFDAGERSLQAALSSLGAEAVEIAPGAVRDVDRPEDLSPDGGGDG